MNNIEDLDRTNKTKASSKHARLAFFWTILGTLGALAVLPYQLAVNPLTVAPVPLPLPALVIAQTVHSCLLLPLLTWLGLRLGQSIGLDSPFARALVYRLERPRIPRRTLLIALLTGAVCGFVIPLFDRLFQPFMPPTTQYGGANIELWKRLLASFYGGITEELLLRLFVMTLIAWIIWKISYKRHRPPTSAIFWISIVIAAIVFGVGHLPAMASIGPLTPVVVIRTIALNALAGLAFGLIYWRWGLEHAMLAHFCADIALHGISGS